MTRIAKVILKSTSGDEYSCSVHYEPDADVVTLPVRLDNLVDASIAMGERHVLLLLEDGYQFPLVRMEPAVYNVDRSKAAKRGWMAKPGWPLRLRPRTNGCSMVASLIRSPLPQSLAWLATLPAGRDGT